MAFASLVFSSARARALFGLVALAGASACVQEQDYLVVTQATWFQSADDCVLAADSDPPATITADLLQGDRIGLGFTVSNNLTANPGSNSNIDDTQVEVESAEVRLSFSGGAIVGDSYEVTVPNNALSSGDEAPFLIQVPTETVDSMRAQMTIGQFEMLEMSVVFVGRKYGASGGRKLGEVTSREFTYPIEVCLGCLPCGVCGFPQLPVDGSCPDEDTTDTTDTTGGP